MPVTVFPDADLGYGLICKNIMFCVKNLKKGLILVGKIEIRTTVKYSYRNQRIMGYS